MIKDRVKKKNNDFGFITVDDGLTFLLILISQMTWAILHCFWFTVSSTVLLAQTVILVFLVSSKKGKSSISDDTTIMTTRLTHSFIRR